MLSLLALFALFALVVVGPAVPSSFAGEAVRVWSYAATERGVGFSGVVAAPSESDGRLEVYFGATTADFGPSEFFVALEHDEVSVAYDQVFVSEPLDPPIRRIAVGNVTGDARLELVTLHEDGEVRSWDRSTWEVVSSFDSSPSPMNLDFVLADVEGDAREEVLLLADGILRVFDGIGTLSWEAPTAGRYLTAGQMDEDPSMEIAIGSGEVFDAASRTEQWRFPSTFNARVIAADVDDDGRDEVLRVDSEIEAFDVDLEANAWTIPEQGFAIEVGERG